jgi:hypothetical protein
MAKAKQKNALVYVESGIRYFMRLLLRRTLVLQQNRQQIILETGFYYSANEL